MQFNVRSLEDAANTVSAAIPAAGATVTSSSLNVGTGRKSEHLALGVDVPALSGLASTKNVTFTLLHSDDNATFVAVPDAAAQVVTGPVSGGSAATRLRCSFPTLSKQYIAMQAVADASAGTISGTWYFKIFA